MSPVEPLHGTWKTWALASGDQFRPGPPLPPDSEEKAAELAGLRGTRSFDNSARAYYWQTFEGIFSYWYNIAHQRLFEYKLDANPPRAAHAYALLSVAHYDASVARWDAKYAYWAPRPFQLDAALTPLFATPNHPSYPAAHGCYSGAIAAVLAHLFPGEAEAITARADEAALSRQWAGIHFPSDTDAGLALGRAVAAAVVERGRTDRARRRRRRTRWPGGRGRTRTMRSRGARPRWSACASRRACESRRPRPCSTASASGRDGRASTSAAGWWAYWSP